jgi:hypothetical protein
MLCNERGKLPSLYTKERTNYVFFYFVPSDNVLGVFDVSLSIRLSHVQIFYHLPKVMLWCEREILNAKNVISKGAYLNDCWIQLASQLSLFAQSHINFAT